MISKRVTYFVRRIIVCLTICTMIVLFALSCQKDEGIKQNDPKALTTAQAKEYFEQTASTLKFLTTGITPAETKNADYSLTENMIIDWDKALEGETTDCYVVEVPIRMSSPITARLYDGVGHLNKNIRQVPAVISLLIERHKVDGCLHHSIVTTVGVFSKSVENSNYGFLCDKSSFSGYQFFSSEEGLLVAANRFNKGSSESRNLLAEANFQKVDSLGNDMHFHGISFATSLGVKTKGGGGASSGEDNRCPNCGTTMQLVYSNYIICYWCPNCEEYFNSFIDPENVCLNCGYPMDNCQCCPNCNLYPCHCCPLCNSYPCICDPFGPGPDPNTGSDPDEPEKPEPGITPCEYCGIIGCDGTCQIIAPNSSGFYFITASADPNSPYGTVIKTPSGNYVGASVSVQLTAYPYTGYTFIGWKSNDAIISTQNPYSFVASSNLIIYAVFATN